MFINLLFIANLADKLQLGQFVNSVLD